MKTKKALNPQRRKDGSKVRRHEQAYGDDKTICMNGGCVLRKKAKCFGFEGCPGFKGS